MPLAAGNPGDGANGQDQPQMPEEDRMSRLRGVSAPRSPETNFARRAIDGELPSTGLRDLETGAARCILREKHPEAYDEADHAR